MLIPARLLAAVPESVEKGNVDAVLDGDLDELIDAYLLQEGSAEK